MKYDITKFPKISVITVCYNSQNTILDTLNSFYNQDYPNKELIIIDGKSNDDTVKIIKDSKVNYKSLVSEEDEGIYDAINKGIILSSGDLIGFLHSDDVYSSKSCLSKIAEKYVSNRSHGIFGDLEYVKSSNPKKIIRKWVAGKFIKKNLAYGWMPPHPTLYIERSVYEEFGTYKLDFKISADYELILRFFWTNSLSLSYIPETLVKMKTGGTSNKNIKNILKKTIEDAKAIKMNNMNIFPALFLKNISKINQFFYRK
jgi:glycosyltransferase